MIGASMFLPPVLFLLAALQAPPDPERLLGGPCADPADYRAVHEHSRRFDEALDDDVNTAQGLGYLFEAVRLTNRLLEQPESTPAYLAFLAHLQEDLTSLGRVLNLLQGEPAATLAELRQKPWDLAVSPEEIEALIARRAEARKNKDWALADKIRNELTGMGILLEDTPQGTVWRVK